jgi:hypothetical protein
LADTSLPFSSQRDVWWVEKMISSQARSNGTFGEFDAV